MSMKEQRATTTRNKNDNDPYHVSPLTGSLDDGRCSIRDVFDGRLDRVQRVLGGSRVVLGALVPAVHRVAGAGEEWDAREPLVSGGGSALAASASGGGVALGRWRRRRGLNFDGSHLFGDIRSVAEISFAGFDDPEIPVVPSHGLSPARSPRYLSKESDLYDPKPNNIG